MCKDNPKYGGSGLIGRPCEMKKCLYSKSVTTSTVSSKKVNGISFLLGDDMFSSEF